MGVTNYLLTGTILQVWAYWPSRLLAMSKNWVQQKTEPIGGLKKSSLSQFRREWQRPWKMNRVEFRIQMGLDSNLSLPRQRYMGQIRRLKFEFKPLDVLEKNTNAVFFRSELLRLRSWQAGTLENYSFQLATQVVEEICSWDDGMIFWRAKIPG